MEMQTVLRKLSSRKLWLAVAGLTAGIAMAFGVDEGALSAVAGAVTAVVSVAVYIATEGKVDAAAVKQAVESVQAGAEAMAGQGSHDQG